MDWVHCNRCLLQPDGVKNFSLTSCGHIYCDECVNRCTENGCYQCRAKCKTVILSSQLKPDVEIFFTEPLILIQKGMQQFQKGITELTSSLANVLSFQKGHRSKFNAAANQKLQDVRSAFESERKKCETLEKELCFIKAEHVKIRQENSQLRKQLEHYRNQSFLSPNGMNRETTPCRSASSLKSPYMDIMSAKQAASSVPTYQMGRASITSPPVNGRIGSIPGSVHSTPTHTPQGSVIRLNNFVPSSSRFSSSQGQPFLDLTNTPINRNSPFVPLQNSSSGVSSRMSCGSNTPQSVISNSASPYYTPSK